MTLDPVTATLVTRESAVLGHLWQPAWKAVTVAAGPDLQQQALEIHRRLLRGDPTASLDAAELLEPLTFRLRLKWPGPDYAEACGDAAVEVLVGYLQAPDRYDPTRSALLTWLVMQAHGDLLNAYASPQKRFERAWLVESSLVSDATDEKAPSAIGDHIPSFDTVPSLTKSTVLTAVADAFPEERDRQLIWLMCVEGSRSTDEAAKVLQLLDLPPDERARAVRRHKDRIMQRLRRLGLDKRDE
ncbi:hypothetical protein [Geodermatophilus sp. URMC 63]